MNRLVTRLLIVAAALTPCLLAQRTAQPRSAPPTPAATPAAPTGERSSADRRAYRRAMEEADQKIADEIKQHSELVKNLEYLTTHIGARLTGSPAMQRASQWTLQRFKDYGVDAHLESTEIPHAYERGVDTAAITAPVQKQVGIHALGWSKPTAGEVTGPVVVLKIDKPEDIAQYKGKLKGAIV